MVDIRLKTLQGNSRRNFLRWATTAGAVLALDRSRVLDVIADSGGSALADEGACAATNRSVHIVAGDGGFSWFQLLWPHLSVARSNNDGFAFHAYGKTTKAQDTDMDFELTPEAPWQSLDKSKRITGFMAGTNQAHTPTPGSAATLGSGQSLLAACASIQRSTPSLLPVIGVDPVNFGSAKGAPDIATVGNADGLVQLFNSAASRAILSVPQDAALYEAYYKAFLGLNRAAARPTMQRPLRIGKSSANFLGQNLAMALQPTDQDLANYGIDGSTPTKLSEIGKILITAGKAFKKGLTQSMILPALRDDPHGAFSDMASLKMTVGLLGRMLDQFLKDLSAEKDPQCTSRTIADNVVLTIHGDTPKDPFTKSGWPDGTPNNANWIYVMGNGYIKTGWFGAVHPDGSTDGFDPTTGKIVQGQAASATSDAAGAAVAFAVAKGDMKRVQEFYSGPGIDGIVNINPAQ
jgi:hypothetical protein